VAVNFLNEGLYTVPEACRLIGVDLQSSPIFSLTGRSDGFVSFLDLVELLFIHRCRKHGVSMQTIRRAAANARPLVQERDTPVLCEALRDRWCFGAGALRDEADAPLVDMRTMQQALKQVVRPFLKDFDCAHDGRSLSKWRPAGRRNPVVVGPRLNFGRPYLAGSGVPVDVIVRARAAGTMRRSSRSGSTSGPSQVRNAIGFAEVPPRVEYSLTPLGRGLAEHLDALGRWIATNTPKVLAAREKHRQRAAK